MAYHYYNEQNNSGTILELISLFLIKIFALINCHTNYVLKGVVDGMYF